MNMNHWPTFLGFNVANATNKTLAQIPARKYSMSVWQLLQHGLRNPYKCMMLFI